MKTCLMELQYSRERPTFSLVLVLVGQMVGSGPGDQLHIGRSINLKEKEALLPSHFSQEYSTAL